MNEDGGWMVNENESVNDGGVLSCVRLSIVLV